MAMVALHGKTQAIDISRVARMDQVAVHRAIKSLMNKDLLLRRQTDAQDKRRKPLQLSKKGRAFYREMLPLARDVKSDLLRLWTCKSVTIFKCSWANCIERQR